MTNIFLLFIIVHVLGDFYFQTENLAKEKREKYRKILYHIGFIFAVSFVCIIPIFSILFLKFIIVLTFLHLIIDSLKFLIEKASSKGKWDKLKKIDDNGVLYIIDQGLHVASIYFLIQYFIHNYNMNVPLDVFRFEFMTWNQILKFTVMYLLILKPVNVTFRKFFLHIKPQDRDRKQDEEKTGITKENEVGAKEYKIGMIIGGLERLLVVTLLIVDQYTAIGLIFAAKSITRYSKIIENKSFAEYYLIGTLFSMLSTLILYVIFK